MKLDETGEWVRYSDHITALAHVNEPPKVEPSAADVAAERQFADYFRKNYPGPDTIIGDPDWHSPRLFRAAMCALIAAGWRRDSAELRAAATDVLKRWDSTDWKAAPTADVMNRLRYALRGKS